MATNPPITIGELADVPAPGSGVKSQWCQEITNRIHHRFATPAARTAAFAAPNPVAVKGQASYLATNDKTEGPEYFNGTTWRKPWNEPWGVLASAIVAVDQAGFGSALSPINGMTVPAVPVVAQRLHRLSVRMSYQAVSSTGNPEFKVFVDGVDSGFIWRESSLAAGAWKSMQSVSILSFATGNRTVTIYGSIQGGGGMSINHGSNCNGVLILEDMGPSGVPS